MKNAMTFFGMAGACAACSAVPLVLALLGAGALGTAWISPALAAGLAAALIVAALAAGIRRQKASIASNGACGCGGNMKASNDRASP